MNGMKILVCTDGSIPAVRAAQEVSLLKFPEESQVVLFHVVETSPISRSKPLEQVFTRAEAALANVFPYLQRRIVSGNAAVQILKETRAGSYNLIVTGDTGTSWGLLHRRIGSTASKILRQVNIPFLLVRRNPDVLKKVLLCTSGEDPAVETLQKGGALVSYSQAEVSVLHVMSQLALDSGTLVDELLDTAQSAMEKRTREGVHLEEAVRLLIKSGVKQPVLPILRHGLVLEQVTAELREGKYNLLVIGSHHVVGRNRLLEAFLEDVASELVSEAPCSVLIV